jgi:membrane fusion protein, multidrug efflux system
MRNPDPVVLERSPSATRPWLGALVWILVLAALAGGGTYWWLYLRPQPAATTQQGGRRGGGPRPDTIPVLVATAQQRDVPIWLDALGTVQASATVTIRPQVDGKLVEVDFREGQDVRAGDVLARIDPRTYQAALDQAIAKKNQDEATLANDKLDVARYAKLAATAYTSAQQLDTARALVAQMEAQVAQDQAQIDNARVQLGYTTITAPIDGRVGIRQVDAGNIVHAADATGLAVITTLRPISVVFTLPQQNLPAVASAMAQGTAEAVALPQSADGTEDAAAADATSPTGGPASNGTAPAERAGRARPIDRGSLTVLDNQVDPTTGTIKLKATFPNAQLALWPGAFVTVRLKVDTRKDAVTVPPVAVQRGPQGAYVYVVGADGLAVRRPVKVSHEDMTTAIVAEGLQPGEHVVIDGASRLTDNAKVTVQPPEGAAPAAPPPRDRAAARRKS